MKKSYHYTINTSEYFAKLIERYANANRRKTAEFIALIVEDKLQELFIQEMTERSPEPTRATFKRTDQQ